MFETFKIWKALVENEIVKKLKCLKFDNGGEYCNKEFEKYCAYNGIHREKTTLRTSQENGVLERMNRTSMEHEATRMIFLTTLGGSNEYNCLFDKHRAFKCFGWWDFKRGMD